VPRPLPPLLTAALRRLLEPDAEMFRAHVSARVVPCPPWEAREQFGLTDRERRLLHSVDGERTVAELLEDVGGSGDWAAGGLGWWLELGLVALEAPVSEWEPEPRSVAERLAAKWAEVEDADYFAILGVSRQASREEVERAFSSLATEFGPNLYAGHPDPAV